MLTFIFILIPMNFLANLSLTVGNSQLGPISKWQIEFSPKCPNVKFTYLDPREPANVMTAFAFYH